MSVSSLHDAPHSLTETCPWCEQPVSHAKFEEIHERIKANERAQTRAIERRLNEEHERKVSEAKARADAEVAKAKKVAADAILRAAKQNGADIETARQTAVKQTQDESAARIKAAEDAKAFADKQVVVERAVAAEAVMKAKQEADAAVALAAEQAEAAVVVARTTALTEAAEKGAAKIKAAEDAKTLADKQLVDERAAAAARLSEQREALENHSAELLAAEKARAFQDQQKWERKIDDLKRQVQNKTAGELGEGAELDLFEELKREYPTDDIRRVKKGLPGADIVHNIIEHGAIVGCVVYDAKNRSQWRNDYVTKLRVDQLAAKADHAILATRVFPSGTAQLATQDGVIVANPARVVELARLIRGHVTHVATLRLSESDRAEKMAAVYDFVTSDRCNQLFAQMDNVSDNMLELDTKEMKAHNDTWKKRGELLRSLQKTQGTLTNEISMIVAATAAPAKPTP